MNNRHFIVFDTETSGLNPADGAEIVQIGAVAYNAHDLSPHPAGEFEIILKPNFPEKASQGALEVIGEDLWNRALKHGVDQKIGLQHFLDYCRKVNTTGQWATKPILVGHNVGFDMRMTEYWMRHYNILTDFGKAPYADHIKLDTMDMMFSLFESDSEVVNYKLDTCLGIFKMKRTGETHDALEDVRLTGELFTRYMKFQRLCRSKLLIK